jgi:hypothetical protein
MKNIILLLALLIPVTSMAQSPTGPMQIVKDHKTVNVNLDTVTPGNTIPIPVSLSSALSVVTADQGDPNTSANAWPIKITDGTDDALVSAAGALKVDGSAVTQPVSGTFWQATQPVSGTFWQATQPVSGTFWQATQPVSAASLPLPSGASTSALQTTGNTSLSTIATNTGKQPINTTGSGSAASATVSTVITLTAPANAVGFILQNLDTSTANVRWAVGRTATTALGQQLQPGRDTGFVPVGANVSLVSESGTQNYDVQWVSQ